MGPTRDGRWWLSAALGLLVAAVGVGAAWPNWAWSPWVVLTGVNVVLCVVLIGAGARLVSRPGQRLNGQLLIAAGVLELMSNVSWDTGPVAVIGWLAGAVTVVPLVWLLLQYPDETLRDRSARMFVAVLSATVLTLRLLETVSWDPSWKGYTGSAWWPTMVHSLPVHTVISAVMWGSNLVLGAWFVVLLVRHHRRMSGLSRRQQVPLLVSGLLGALVFGLVVPVAYLQGLPGTGNETTVWDVVVYVSQAVAVVVVLAAFAWAMLLTALDRARVAHLIVALDSARDPESVQRALREALADPDLRLLFREDPTSDWVDARGHRSDPTHEVNRTLVPLGAAGSAALEAIDVHVSLAPDILAATASASRLALDNARLQALAQARLDDVVRSRQRLAEVGLAERRRLERDLHDGAQQRLLAVSAGVAAARAGTDDPAMQVRLDDIRDGLRVALAELRDLAHGIHPAVLTQAGLGPALENAAERLPLVVILAVEPRRWPPPVESAAYFVTCEALTNAVRHGDAAHVTVSVTTAQGHIVLTVHDDGIGGATSRPDGSGGLTGVRDRVAAMGGDVHLTSPPGAGTTLRVRLPCE